MEATSKFCKLMKTGRDPQEVQDWLFSLAPLGVAFAFFLIFLWPMDIANIIIVLGTAAGFIGLESYWIFRGWCKNHMITILLGLIGIAITVALAWLYVTFA